MKKCSKCKELLLTDNFYKNRKKPDGLQTYCKTCSHKRRVQYYKENKESENLRNKHTYERYVQRFNNYKQTLSCGKCNETRWYTLDFHHVIGSKESNISTMIAKQYSWNKVLAEINKCEVLCSNCHRELHFLEKAGALV